MTGIERGLVPVEMHRWNMAGGGFGGEGCIKVHLRPPFFFLNTKDDIINKGKGCVFEGAFPLYSQRTQIYPAPPSLSPVFFLTLVGKKISFYYIRCSACNTM